MRPRLTLQDPVDYKVLLNSDTTCEVYFEPKGPNPIWKPDYVQASVHSQCCQALGQFEVC